MKNSHLLIIGDFNYKDIDWKLQQSTVGIEHDTTKFLETINDCYLFQHVNEATRYREGQNESTLDLILTNEELMVNDIDYITPIGKSDHTTLFFNYNCYTETKSDESVPRYIYILKEIMSSFEK